MQIKKGEIKCPLGLKPLCMDKTINYYCENWDKTKLVCKSCGSGNIKGVGIEKEITENLGLHPGMARIQGLGEAGTSQA